MGNYLDQWKGEFIFCFWRAITRSGLGSHQVPRFYSHLHTKWAYLKAAGHRPGVSSPHCSLVDALLRRSEAFYISGHFPQGQFSCHVLLFFQLHNVV